LKYRKARRFLGGGGSFSIGYKGIHEFIIEYLNENQIRFKQID